MILDQIDDNARDGRNLIRLALISIILFIIPIFFIGLSCGDETRVAGIAAEMAIENDYLTPKLNGTAFLEYPPLFYAAAATTFRVLGFTAFAAKLPAALSAMAGVLLIYILMRVLRRPKYESFAGAFMMATELQYLTNAYDCRVDMMLTAFCLVVWAGFALMEFYRRGAAWRIAGMATLAVGVAGAALTKNLTGLAITLPGIAVTLAWRDLLERRFSFAAYFRLAGAVLIGMIPYAFYLWLLYGKNGAECVETLFWYNNFGRFSGSVKDHCAPWWGYWERIYEYFQPYLLLLLGGMWLQIRQWRKNRSVYGMLSLTWLVIPFLILSVANSKRQVYLLPLAAPAAMLAASTVPYVILGLSRKIGGKALAQLRRRANVMIYAAAVLFALLAGAVSRHDAAKRSIAQVFAEAEARGGSLVLVSPGERHSGAAVFYCRKVVPQQGNLEKLLPHDVALVPMSRKGEKKIPEGWSGRYFEKVKVMLLWREQ